MRETDYDNSHKLIDTVVSEADAKKIESIILETVTKLGDESNSQAVIDAISKRKVGGKTV
jgi:hypothetical protein